MVNMGRARNGGTPSSLDGFVRENPIVRKGWERGSPHVRNPHMINEHMINIYNGFSVELAIFLSWKSPNRPSHFRARLSELKAMVRLGDVPLFLWTSTVIDLLFATFSSGFFVEDFSTARVQAAIWAMETIPTLCKNRHLQIPPAGRGDQFGCVVSTIPIDGWFLMKWTRWGDTSISDPRNFSTSFESPILRHPEDFCGSKNPQKLLTFAGSASSGRPPPGFSESFGGWGGPRVHLGSPVYLRDLFSHSKMTKPLGLRIHLMMI